MKLFIINMSPLFTWYGVQVIHGEKSRDVFTIEYISNIGSTLASQSSLEDSSGHATCHNLPAAAIAPELLVSYPLIVWISG